MSPGEFISACARGGFRPPFIDANLVAQIGQNPTEDQGAQSGDGPIVSAASILPFDQIISEARRRLLHVIFDMHRSVIAQRSRVIGWKCTFCNPFEHGIPDDPGIHYFCNFSMITDQPNDIPDWPRGK